MNRPKTYVYIAGPYGDHDGYTKIERRINIAREAAAQLARRGVNFFCPHLNSAHFEVITPNAGREFWIEQGLVFVRYAWAIWLLPEWESSAGVEGELTAAKAIGMDVYMPDELDTLVKAWKSDAPRKGPR